LIFSHPGTRGGKGKKGIKLAAFCAVFALTGGLALLAGAR